MCFFLCALAGVAAPQGTFIWLDTDNPCTVQHCVRRFSLTAFCGKTRRLTYIAHSGHLLNIPIVFIVTHAISPLGHRFIVAKLVPLYGERTATVDTGKLLQPACKVGSIVPCAPTFTPHVHACEISQGNLCPACLTGLHFVCFWSAISFDILATAAFEQQIPCLLFHTSHHPKNF